MLGHWLCGVCVDIVSIPSNTEPVSQLQFNEPEFSPSQRVWEEHPRYFLKGQVKRMNVFSAKGPAHLIYLEATRSFLKDKDHKSGEETHEI